MTDLIKKRIQELVPEVIAIRLCECPMHTRPGFSVEHGLNNSPLTLAVVLRAIANEPADFSMWVDATSFEIPHFLMTKRDWKEDEPIFAWDLTKDYDQQSEECKQFIGSLILP